MRTPGGGTHVHCECGDLTCEKDGEGHTKITFNAWTDADNLPSAAGNYYLDVDVTTKSRWTVPTGEVNLCLHGHTILYSATNYHNEFINIQEGRTLKLFDCKTEGKITRSVSVKGSCVSINGGTLVMNGGTICGFKSWGVSGAVYVNKYGSANGKFVMNGGVIGPNDDRGVYVISGCSFVMNGGKICDNKVSNAGGGVYVDSNGKFEMNGGEISSNTAARNGGGVWAKGTVTLTGGTITKNKCGSDYDGGGIYLDSGSVSTISGNIQIKGNFKAAGENEEADKKNDLDFYYRGNRILNIDSVLGDDAEIWVSSNRYDREFSITVTFAGNEANKDKFFADDNGWEIGLSNKKIVLKPVSYKITYDLQGGYEWGSNPKSYTVVSNPITLNEPRRDDYDFAGWTGSNGDIPELAVKIPKGSTGDRTYTANWTVKTYTVTYNANGGSCDPANAPVAHGGTYETLPTPVRAGFVFDGWYTSVSGGTKVSEGDAIKQNSNHTLYAHWTEISVTLNKSEITLEWGGTGTLVAAVTPASAAGKTVTWSSDSSVITVTTDGVVTAKGVGSATITASVEGKTATCSVTVTKKKLTREMITLNVVSGRYPYTGSSITPVVTVEDGNTILGSGDYSVSGEVSATEVGSYTLIIEGTGNYTGTVDVDWHITDTYPPTGTIKIGTVTWTSFGGSVSFDKILKES